jgi:hypothetical protein
MISVVEYFQFCGETAMRNNNLRGMITAGLVAAILMQSCAFKYEPSIPPVDWGGGPTPQPVETLPPAVGPYGSTCEGEPDLYYCRVPCPTGPAVRVCYKLCLLDECKIYAMDNLEVAPRVDAFIRAVHNWHEKVTQLGSMEDTAKLSFYGVIFACGTASMAGLSAAGKMLQEGPPTPEWLVGVGIAAFVLSLGGCAVAAGKSILNSLSVPGIIEDERKWLKDALDNWSILHSCPDCEE